MSISFRNRLAFRLELLRQSRKEYGVGAVLAAVMVSIVAVPVFYFDSPVSNYERLQAVVISIPSVHMKGFSPSLYMAKLIDDGQLVTIKDSRLHEIGTIIKVERRTRKNGVVTYHLVPPGCETPDCAGP
ncbi:hypothetical protein [Pseudaminobacter soli (ex Li et al. 2025)]|uniref:Uncharacterized protein n=1 Tax=Pseudaminobacter soli (ex Li et al. 2025) TaxID=1295366 RepID=A0A2P7RZK3_9HYPH|nr:hypothetical protein [Mesorhizobium soli]PSJ55623.1 hypothetical protein C7I85_26605 [Mesorhizobium soli]